MGHRTRVRHLEEWLTIISVIKSICRTTLNDAHSPPQPCNDSVAGKHPAPLSFLRAQVGITNVGQGGSGQGDRTDRVSQTVGTRLTRGSLLGWAAGNQYSSYYTTVWGTTGNLNISRLQIAQRYTLLDKVRIVSTRS